MKIHRTWLAPVMTALAFGLMTGMASAQGGGPGGGGGGGGFGGFNGDPAQMRQQIQDMMMQGYRDQLEITSDDEWNVIKERVVKVMDAQQEATGAGGLGGMARMFGRGRGGGGGGGGGGGRGMAALLGGNPMPEQEALQTAVDAKATAEQLKDKLEKYRAARKAREDKLAAARKELRALLSQRQEVEAVLAGLLD